MEHEKLFIAPKIKVGFQNRNDTYTQKLAYVIYYDKKGVLRKQSSWENWRDHSIDSLEFENVPTEGFVLNKKVGGGRSDWNHRQEYVRVYDPRNFEFEITVPNLLFILKECDCSRGKGLEGKFVYAWSGTTLVLLPAASEEYTSSANFTNLQDKTVKVKDLVKGVTYMTRQQEKWTYLDRRFKYMVAHTGYRPEPSVSHDYVFVDEDGDFVFQKDVKRLAVAVSDIVAPNYAELVEKYDKSAFGSEPVRLFLQDQPAHKPDPKYHYRHYSWSSELSPGEFHQFHTRYSSDGQPEYTDRVYKISLKDQPGTIHKGKKFIAAAFDRGSSYRVAPGHRYYNEVPIPWAEPTNTCVWVELASGSKFKLNDTELVTPGANDGED